MERLADLLFLDVLLGLCSCDAMSASEHRHRASLQHQAAILLSVCSRWRGLLAQQSRSWVALDQPREGSSLWAAERRRARQMKPAVHASNVSQLSSLPHKLAKRPNELHALYSELTLEDRSVYFAVSCRPVTKTAENDLEMLSDLVTWGERFLQCWTPGIYVCGRCKRPLYKSSDKWSGPCVWPSFRKSISDGDENGDENGDDNGEDGDNGDRISTRNGDGQRQSEGLVDKAKAVSETFLEDYNGYACAVAEVYCGGCDLFLGHKFQDARAKGDDHPDATGWRH
mmetsp:Transcript_68929/g.129486  ORF Transcript_68929/g.129486 Transcript_68929/m.129486 type:complete len:284 (+) Transcript_68929:71-922(+)